MLNEHLKKVAESLLSKADEIGLAKHTTVSGTARELIISDFLSKNLPRGFDFDTGEIAASDGTRSGQIDILVLPHYSPKFALLDRHCIALADAVAASIEVKSNLTTAPIESRSELNSALLSIKKIREMPLNLDPWPWTASVHSQNVRLTHIPCFVISFDGPTPDKLIEHLKNWSEVHGDHTLPNTVTCLKRNYTIVKNDGWHLLPVDYASYELPYFQSSDPCLVDLFLYLMKCLQAWGYEKPRTPLNQYR